jgi:hypothetical protein
MKSICETTHPETGQGHNKKKRERERELQANLVNEVRCKNSQENPSKPNSTAYQKIHTP